MLVEHHFDILYRTVVFRNHLIRTPSHRESLKKRAVKHSTGSNMKRVKPRVSDVSLMGLKSSCRDYLDKKESGVINCCVITSHITP